jgi:hypothetical protein
MSVFNKVVTVVLFLLLMVAVPLTLIFPDAIIGLAQQLLPAVAASLTTFQRVIFALMGVIGFIVCGLVLYLEFRRPRRRRAIVEKTAGGEVEVALDSIAQRLEYRIDQLGDVVKVTPKIKPRRKDIDVELDLETTPDIDVPAKTEEVRNVAREVVEDRMGLKLRKIKVNMRHTPYPELS